MIRIEWIQGAPAGLQPTEIVERKGVGHPDTICDGVAEAVSLALCDAYRRRSGGILHHNADKVLLAAGTTAVRYGGGRMSKKIELVIGDRATDRDLRGRIPVREIAEEAAVGWIRRHLRHVDPNAHVRIRTVLAPGSDELRGIFLTAAPVMPANDTSAAVGFYPLTLLENSVLALERYLNGPAFKAAFPETGEDVKVMAFREGRRFEFTVAMPLVSRWVESEESYFRKKDEVTGEIGRFLREGCGIENPDVHLNALDRPRRGAGGVYLTLLGTSAEDGDSGEVGRGNRVNGIISVLRPLGTEAAAGKNPVSHVGKIYNVLTHELARAVYTAVPGIREVYVCLLSRIGEPVDRPRAVTVRICAEPGADRRTVSAAATDVIETELANIPAFCSALSRGRFPVW